MAPFGGSSGMWPPGAPGSPTTMGSRRATGALGLRASLGPPPWRGTHGGQEDYCASLSNTGVGQDREGCSITPCPWPHSGTLNGLCSSAGGGWCWCTQLFFLVFLVVWAPFLPRHGQHATSVSVSCIRVAWGQHTFMWWPLILTSFLFFFFF